MTRYPDWQGRLDRFLLENAGRKFAYGEWDCCLFVCGAIEAMTGVDPAAEFRGMYRSKKEALQYANAAGIRPRVRSIAEIVAERYRMPLVLPSLASRGDVALIRRSSDYSLGLIALNGWGIIVVTRGGCEMISRDEAVLCWRV